MNISHQSELIKHFRDRLENDPDFAWVWSDTNLFDSTFLRLKLDGKQILFETVFDLYPGEARLRILSNQTGRPVLLVVPEINDRLLNRCKESELNIIDLNGRVWIRDEGVWIQRPALPGRHFHYALEPRNIFVGKSERIVRSLLTDREKQWSQSELVERSGASSGLVSRIVKYLVKQEYVTRTGTRTFQVKDSLELLDSWAAADRLSDRVAVIRITGLNLDPWDWADRVEFWAKEESIKLAFTQWTGAWERHGYTEPALCSAYVSRFPSAKQLETWGAREVTEAGSLWLFLPKDEGVFREIQRPVSRNLVSDAQIYLDLQNTGLRGPEAAQALRGWEGFCRP